MRSACLLVLLVGCSNDRGPASSAGSAAAASPPAPAPAVASAPDLVATTWCDWYWRSTMPSAREYDSREACVAASTVTPSCTEQQAQACAAFARTAEPGQAPGLNGSPDCVACLDAMTTARHARAFAEEQAALDRATLTVHTARRHDGAWPADIADRRTADAILVAVDVELSGYGYRIDPDDFVLVTATGAPVADGPYAERLTRAGTRVDWTDASVVDDPDLRVRAFFPVPTAARATPLAVSYNGKQSTPFTVR